MPLYEYECTACHRTTEKRQKFSDPEITDCPFCQGRLERVISAPAVHFAGGGWYADLYSSKGAAKKDGAGAGSEGAANEAKSTEGEGSKANESKTDSGKGGDSGKGSSAGESSAAATSPAPSAPASTPSTSSAPVKA